MKRSDKITVSMSLAEFRAVLYAMAFHINKHDDDVMRSAFDCLLTTYNGYCEVHDAK